MRAPSLTTFLMVGAFVLYGVAAGLLELVYYGVDDHFCSSGGWAWRMTPMSRVLGHVLALTSLAAGLVLLLKRQGARRLAGVPLLLLASFAFANTYRMVGSGCWTDDRMLDTTLMGTVTYWRSEPCLAEGYTVRERGAHGERAAHTPAQMPLGATLEDGQAVFYCEGAEPVRFPLRRFGLWALDSEQLQRDLGWTLPHIVVQGHRSAGWKVELLAGRGAEEGLLRTHLERLEHELHATATNVTYSREEDVARMTASLTPR